MIDENILLEIIENQNLEFPISLPIIISEPNQLHLRVAATVNQNMLCACGLELDNSSELHHALISKKDVVGHPTPDFIHHSYNVLMLHHSCHMNINRLKSYNFLCEIYGKNQIKNWYDSIEFKSRFRRI